MGLCFKALRWKLTLRSSCVFTVNAWGIVCDAIETIEGAICIQLLCVLSFVKSPKYGWPNPKISNNVKHVNSTMWCSTHFLDCKPMVSIQSNLFGLQFNFKIPYKTQTDTMYCIEKHIPISSTSNVNIFQSIWYWMRNLIIRKFTLFYQHKAYCNLYHQFNVCIKSNRCNILTFNAFWSFIVKIARKLGNTKPDRI